MKLMTSGSISGEGLYDKKPFTWKSSARSAVLYNQATKYLRQSSAAEALLNYLHGVSDITILCTDDTDCTFYAAETVESKNWLPQGSLVTWNPFSTLRTADSKAHLPKGRRFRAKPGSIVVGTQSPAMGLIHELGHARQYLLKNKWFMDNYNKAIDKKDNNARLLIEHDNLLTVESVVARQLGENVRWKYDHCIDGPEGRNVKYVLTSPSDPLI